MCIIDDSSRYSYLSKYESQADEDIDLARLALDMVVLDHEGISLDRYIWHFEKLSSKVTDRYKELLDKGSDDDILARLAALKYVLSDIYNYKLDDPDSEILEGADIMRVIDRAKGCGTALSVIYMAVARSQNWIIEGLDFPNMFLCRLIGSGEELGQRIIFTPAFPVDGQCRILKAHDLRFILKAALGETAELSNQYFDGLGARGSIINLCNHIKLRHIEMGDYVAALDMVLRMSVVAPDEYRLLLDLGVLYAKTQNKIKAIECLESYIVMAPNNEDRLQARNMIDDLLI